MAVVDHKQATGRDSRLLPAEFDAAAVIEKVERFAPPVIAFVGKRAAREVLGGSRGYGRQALTIGSSDVWVVLGGLSRMEKSQKAHERHRSPHDQ